MNRSFSYFFQTFVVIVLSGIAFLLFKEILPKRIFSVAKPSSQNIVIDSVLLETITLDEKKITKATNGVDSFKRKRIVYEKVDGIAFPDEQFEQYKGFQFMIPFFEKLYLLEYEQKGDVRIAYFGDYMTDGVMIVQDFRNYFQSQYGGKGVGFVSITSESAASRSSVIHQYSGNWKTQSYLNVKRPTKPFGVNGHVFFANDTLSNSWVFYKAGHRKHTDLLYQPTLFYGFSDNLEGEVIFKTGKDTLVKKLTPAKLVNTLAITNTNIKSLKASFNRADSIPIYGFNFDDGKGVHVDNFSNRGNSGLPISTFKVNVMNAFQERLDYDLIILHYGTNVLNYGSYNYDWYERKMAKVVEHLKACFPGVTVLVVSTADKATKYELEMKTDSAVIPLANAQKKYALLSKSGYFNLFEAMGGEGSMTKWVEKEVPAMAAKDYTHFSYKGAQKVAEMLYQQLQNGYLQYKEMRLKRKKDLQKMLMDSVSSKSNSTNVQ
jgi:lysophospholipase L1-like esterase